MAEIKPFSISRVVKAPRELVYKVHTDPAHIAKWMGPAGMSTLKADMDFRVGGRYHYGLKGADGSEMWGKQVFKEIVPNSKLVYVQSFSDKDGGFTRHPMAPTWPLEMLATVTFEDAGEGKTKITISWHPINASDGENAAFDSARDSMVGGFGGQFAKLEEYLGGIHA